MTDWSASSWLSARPRHEMVGGNFYGEFHSVENPALKLRAVAEHHRTPAQPKGVPKAPTKTKKDSESAQPRSHKRSYRRSDRKQDRRSRTRSRPKRKARTPRGRPLPKRRIWKLGVNPASFGRVVLFLENPHRIIDFKKIRLILPHGTPPAVKDDAF